MAKMETYQRVICTWESNMVINDSFKQIESAVSEELEKKKLLGAPVRQ